MANTEEPPAPPSPLYAGQGEPRDRPAAEFWQGRCLDCAHPEHEMTCHEIVPNGDPSNGPAYCSCAVHIELMEQEIVRLRAAIAERDNA